MGFPGWKVACDWLDGSLMAPEPSPSTIKGTSIKNPEIPELKDYRSSLGEEFWKSFPKKALPEKAETEVLTDVFEELIDKASERMTACELRRAKKVISDLRNGAEAFQSCELPPVNGVNAQSTFTHGRLLTDTIATWVKKGFVAGPFDCPPVAGFRANPLGVIVKNGKTRPILNMSGPIGKSFNDNVNRRK